jgi:hypothetical protein
VDSHEDRHHFDADPDPNFHVDADPDPDSDPDWHQHDAELHANPTLVSHMLENRNFFLLLVTSCRFTMFYLSHECQRSHNFKYFEQHI